MIINGDRRPRISAEPGDVMPAEEVLTEFLISGTNQPWEPMVIRKTPDKGVYDVVNSPLGTQLIRMAELGIRAQLPFAAEPIEYKV